MDAKKRSDLDVDLQLLQDFATISEICEQLPIQWGKIFHGCLEEGFTTEQAMDLVKTHISSLNMGAGGSRDGD